MGAGFDHAEMAAACRHWANRWVRIDQIQGEYTPAERAEAEEGWASYEVEHDGVLKCLAARTHPGLVQQIIALLHQDADYHCWAASEQAAATMLATNRSLEERVASLEAQLDAVHGATGRAPGAVAVAGPGPTACTHAAGPAPGAARR